MTADLGAIDPHLLIVDCHHHLWHPHDTRYFTDAFQADIAASGHNVAATVYVEGGAMLRASGPEALRSVGEAEFVAGMAAMADSGTFGSSRICAGFVGAADLSLGDKVDDVLKALAAASGNRLRGIRGSAIWDPDPAVNTGTRPMAPHDLMARPSFRAGVARLAQRGLVYDSWAYYSQLLDVCALAEAVPEATIIVNHCGGLLRIGSHATPDTFARWRKLVFEAARRPNILMKIGGLAGARTGFGYEKRTTRPDLAELVADWTPYVESCIEAFGPERCMFESNFPVDRVAGDYRMIWNVFKTITEGCSTSQKALMFATNAVRTYGLEDI